MVKMPGVCEFLGVHSVTPPAGMDAGAQSCTSSAAAEDVSGARYSLLCDVTVGTVMNIGALLAEVEILKDVKTNKSAFILF